MLIWLIRRLHCDLKETLMDARLLARAFTLEQYDAMSELERRQTCEELWARAVADSALRRDVLAAKRRCNYRSSRSCAR